MTLESPFQLRLFYDFMIIPTCLFQISNNFSATNALIMMKCLIKLTFLSFARAGIPVMKVK